MLCNIFIRFIFFIHVFLIFFLVGDILVFLFFLFFLKKSKSQISAAVDYFFPLISAYFRLFTLILPLFLALPAVHP